MTEGFGKIDITICALPSVGQRSVSQSFVKSEGRLCSVIMNNNNHNCDDHTQRRLEDLGVIPVWADEYAYLDSEDDWLNPLRKAHPAQVKHFHTRGGVRQPLDELRERSRSVSLGRVPNSRLPAPQSERFDTEESDDDEDATKDHPLPTPGRIMPVISMSTGNASVERTKTFTRKRLNGTITKLVKRTGTFKARSLSTTNGSTGSLNTSNGSNGLLYNNNFEYLRDLETTRSQDILSTCDLDLDNNDPFALHDNDPFCSPADQSLLNSTFTKRMSRLNSNTFRKPASSFSRTADHNRNHAYPTMSEVFPHRIQTSTPVHAEPKILPRKPTVPIKPSGLIRKIPEPRSLSSSRECLGPPVNSLSSGLRAPQVRTGWSATATTSTTPSTSNRAQTPSGIPGFGRR